MIEQNRNRQNGLIQAHIAVLLFGLAGLFGKWLLLPALIIVMGRVFFASISLGFILGFSNKHSLNLENKKSLILLIVLGIILAFHWFSFFHAIQLTTVALGLITFATFPVFTALLEPLFFKEKFEAGSILLAIGAAFGVYLAAREGLDKHLAMEGITWGILSGFSFALLTLGNRKVLVSTPALKVAFYQDLFALLSLIPFLFIIEFQINFQEILLLILLGTLFTALAHYLFIQSLDSIKAKTASIISSLEPVYGILLAALILGEIPGTYTILGTCIILSITFYISVFNRR